MKRKIFSISIVILGLAFINPVSGSNNFSNDQDQYRISSENTIDHKELTHNFSIQAPQDINYYDGNTEVNLLVDLDSLQLVGGFQEFYFVEKEAAPQAELEESFLSLDTELVLESWMTEAFEIETMDQEMNLEDWMLEPFEKNN